MKVNLNACQMSEIYWALKQTNTFESMTITQDELGKTTVEVNEKIIENKDTANQQLLGDALVVYKI